MNITTRHFLTYSKPQKILLHSWIAQSGSIVNNKWLDLVKNSKYSAPIDWNIIGNAHIENGYMICNYNNPLSTYNFKNPIEKWGKYWEIKIVAKVPSVFKASMAKNVYLIDMISVLHTHNNTAADSISFTDNEIMSNTKLYYNEAIYNLNIKNIPFNYSGGDHIFAIGVEPIDKKYACHYISIDGNKIYNSNPFIARDIGNDITWNDNNAYLGRAYANGYTNTALSTYIKSVEMFRLQYD